MLTPPADAVLCPQCRTISEAPTPDSPIRADGLALTDEQWRVVRAMVQDIRHGRPQVTLGGFAGVGKSTVARFLLEELPGRYAPCAFTGKAANVLRQKGMSEARTIHSLIYHPVRDPETHRVHFVLREPDTLDDIDGFLVDEASMISRDLHRDLLSFGKPCIFIGDHGQLEPVGSDINLMADPNYRLETIHRHAGPIAEFGEAIRQQQWHRVETWPSMPEIQRLRRAEAVERYREADQIICAFNRTRVQVNRTVRLQRDFLPEVPQAGDRIICLRNNRQEGLFNGMQGVLLRLDSPELPKPTLDFQWDGDSESFTELPYLPKQFGSEKTIQTGVPFSTNLFDWAYCVSAHKSQGSEWPTVLVLAERIAIERADLFTYWRWAYTAATRARSSVWWAT